MDRFSGLKRNTMIAALMVLSTGACAQRVTPLPQSGVLKPQAVAPVAQAPAATPPAAQTPAPRPVAKAPAAPENPAAPPQTVTPPAPQQVAKATPPAAPKPAATPAPPIATQPLAPPAATPESTAPEKRGFFDFILPKAEETAPAAPETAPMVALTEPTELGGQYQTAEVASADYGSSLNSNPTPDTAIETAALLDSDTPLTPPALAPVAPTAPAEPEVIEPEPIYEPLSALASLFGEPEPEPPAAMPVPRAANSLEPPQTPEEAAAPAEPESPYPGSFADDEAYETAQVAQTTYGYGTPTPPAAYNPNAPVTVAILTPDTDSRPSIRNLAKGLAQAAALSARALGNRQLVLRGYDTGGTPEKAQVAAQQALADGAQLIIGPLFSSSASAVAPLAQGAGVPVIAFTTDRGVLRRGVYSLGYLPDAEVERMLSYAAKRGIRKIGLLSPDTPYGGIVYRNIQNAAPGYGINVATVQPISQNFAQAAETGQRFADFYKGAPDTQGVLIATNGKPLQAIAAYLAYNDVLPSKVQYMGLGTWDDPETFREATLRGGWFPGLDPALKAEFERRYSGAYGGKPPTIAALAYDGVAIAGALLKRAQSTGQPPFTPQAIESPTGFRGMSGLFRLMPDGRNQRLLSVLKVGRRQFEMIDPAPSTFSQRLTSITGYRQ